MTVLTVKIKSPLADEIERLVKDGVYPDADEAVAGILGDALSEPESPEYVAWLKAELQKGIDDIEAGRIVDWDPDAIKREVERRHRER